ncbi:MAG TPA: hypothetical protein VGO57_17910 [Verrucomicrobiae bacterium]|jgi:hypothetical protein
MRPEKQRLLDALLAEENRQQATLFAAGQILRRRRHWRAVKQAGLTLLVVLMGTVIFWRMEKNQKSATFQASLTPAIKPDTAIHYLTDNELLSLFSNTPVGLITLPNGKKLLIFPHSGDEQRFVTRI